MSNNLQNKSIGGGVIDFLTQGESYFYPITLTDAVYDINGTLLSTTLSNLKIDIDGKQPKGSYANASHSHAISEITNLQTTLDNKQPKGSYAAASHTHNNYLPLSGGVMTGNVKYNIGECTIIPMEVWAGDNYGNGIIIGAGGPTIISSGESGKALRDNIPIPGTNEILYLASDNSIEIYVACQTIDNKIMAVSIPNNGVVNIFKMCNASNYQIDTQTGALPRCSSASPSTKMLWAW